MKTSTTTQLQVEKLDRVALDNQDRYGGGDRCWTTIGSRHFLDNGGLEKVDLDSLWAPWFSRDQKTSKIGWLSKVPTSTIEDWMLPASFEVFLCPCRQRAATWLFKGAKAQLRHETSEDNELNR